AGLVDLAADLGQRRAGLDDIAVADGELCTHRHDELALLLVALPDLDHRVEPLLAVLRDDELAAARRLVELLAHRLVLDDVDELDAAADVGDDWLRVRVPAEEQVAWLGVLVLLARERGAVRHRQAAAHGGFLGQHHDLALAARHDALARRRLDHGDALELRATRDLRLACRLRRDARRRTTDVERAERELRARLTDRLCGQDADRLADVDHLHRREVAAVALTADAALRLAGQHGADLHRLDARVLDEVRVLLGDHLARLDDELAVDRVVDVLECDVADDAVLQRLDD